MRIPNRIAEHPVEAVVAGVLLLALLFGSVDFQPVRPAAAGTQVAEKM